MAITGHWKKAEQKISRNQYLGGLSLEERFWLYIDKNGPIVRPELGSCWIWKGNLNTGGYGRLADGKRGFLAHRVSWIIHYGQIPKGKFVLYHCDNAACARPEHFFLGTIADNNRDMTRKGRGARKLTVDQVHEIRASSDFAINLAQRYGVSRTNIYFIQKGKAWAWV